MKKFDEPLGYFGNLSKSFTNILTFEIIPLVLYSLFTFSNNIFQTPQLRLMTPLNGAPPIANANSIRNFELIKRFRI